MHPRSGLAARHGVTVLNAPGTVDAGYRGEIRVTLLNTDRSTPVTFHRGDRIAQLVVQRVEQAEFVLGTELPGSARGSGGFGSTGGHLARKASVAAGNRDAGSRVSSHVPRPRPQGRRPPEMELTSGAFVALMAVLSVAGIAAIVFFWPLLSAQRPLPVIGRVGALLGVNLLLLATIGLVANDTFGFFADWTDLAGAFASAPAPGRTSHAGTDPNAAVQAPLGAGLSAPSTLPPLPTPANGNREYSFLVPGPVSHVTGKVVVYLPAGYTDRRQARRRYPVIETFHGYPGRPEQWLDSMALGEVLDEQVSLGRMSPAIVIAPELEIPPGRDTECVDGGTAGPAMETWLTTDVPEWAARTLRVRLDRSSWATAGLSAGGGARRWRRCSTRPATARRWSSVATSTRTSARPTSRSPHGSPQGRRYDLVALVRRAPPPVAIWMETSHSDKVSYRSSADFLAAVRGPACRCGSWSSRTRVTRFCSGRRSCLRPCSGWRRSAGSAPGPDAGREGRRWLRGGRRPRLVLPDGP